MSDEKNETEQAPEPPKWEKRELAINARMRELVGLGIKATEAEIVSLRKKLKKLQYGG